MFSLPFFVDWVTALNISSLRLTMLRFFNLCIYTSALLFDFVLHESCCSPYLEFCIISDRPSHNEITKPNVAFFEVTADLPDKEDKKKVISLGIQVLIIEFVSCRFMNIPFNQDLSVVLGTESSL